MKNRGNLAVILCLFGIFFFTGCTSVATERIGEYTVDLRYHQNETADDIGISGIARIWNYHGKGVSNVTLTAVFFDSHGVPVGSKECNIGDMFPGQSYPFTITYPKSGLGKDGLKNDHTMISVVIDNSSYLLHTSSLPIPEE